MTGDGLAYDDFVQDALRGVVIRALKEVAENGLPGEHHFFITFRTAHPGAIVPPHLRAQYADEMTIVLQHQFSGLFIDDEHFEVTLNFNRKPERLSIEFAAITAFVDPSVNFGLQFRAEDDDDDASPAVGVAAAGSEAEALEESDDPGDDGAPSEPAEKVVSLDSFRKKK